ncbi:uncharacterized protein RAG0_07903 [Rhynchosporium agropyri]|uniref:Cyanovirin-N domain-containing protein n=1 Tax=Rhynchosporium agropyri TaxID=914238 RepID=A0A1E1KND3_9HELO|nr:uncharacterized protein RAG0_07903 [Rhynchosporium agropyri]
MRFCVLPLITLPAALAFGGFTNSCTKISYSYPSIHATCRSSAHGTVDTSFDLSLRLANANGRLIWGANKDNFHSCKCSLDRSKAGVLDCDCMNLVGTYIKNRINLNAHCDNQNGYLTCD